MLSRGDYGAAVRQFDEALEIVRTSRARLPGHPDFGAFHQFVLLTRMCQGYAFLKIGEYKAAANSWGAFAHHAALISDEKKLSEKLRQLQTQTQRHSYDARSVSELKDGLFFDLLVHFKMYEEAIKFIEENSLHLREAGPKEWTFRLLFVYLMDQKFEQAESAFLDFVHRNGMSTPFKSQTAALNTSLYTGWFEIPGRIPGVQFDDFNYLLEVVYSDHPSAE